MWLGAGLALRLGVMGAAVNGPADPIAPIESPPLETTGPDTAEVRPADPQTVPLSLGIAGYSARQWTVQDGLPMQDVTSHAQAPDGFLWCGTFDGLARFDRLKFKVFPPHAVPALKVFQITGLHTDGLSRLWIMDAKGKLAWYKDGRLRRCGKESGLPDEPLGGCPHGADGSVWFRGLNNGGFFISSKNASNHWRRPRFPVRRWMAFVPASTG